jgi:type II secretory ATPase GspE/PulE/Tfp pilus assembly ATPase PilB-like protein
MFLDNGILKVSSAWRGTPELMSFYELARRRGVIEVEFLKAEDFQRSYEDNSRLENTEDKNSELQAFAKDLIQKAYEQKASDIHIADFGTYGTIEFRCLGMLKKISEMTGDKIQHLIAVIYSTMSSQCSTTSHSPSVYQDARITRREFLPSAVNSIRVHTAPIECSGGDADSCFMVLRLLYDSTNASGSLYNRLTCLGYSQPDINRFRFLTERSGLVVVSAPTGHGKTTVLNHTMEAQAFESPEKSFQSIEDPPERTMMGVKQVKVNTSANFDDPESRMREYINALANALRLDPDVLMIGEIRYPDAAVAAIDAALTGHSVWTTLHANNALGIILRMQSLLSKAYAEPLEYLCDHNVVAGLIYQRLVPVLCPQCKIRLRDLDDAAYRRSVMPDYTFERLKKAVENPENVHVRGKGCNHCQGVGFTEQTIVAEVIVTDQTILKLIRRESISSAYQYWRTTLHGRTYIQDAIGKIEAGILDPHKTELRLGVPLTFDPVDPAKMAE